MTWMRSQKEKAKVKWIQTSARGALAAATTPEIARQPEIQQTNPNAMAVAAKAT